MHNTMRRRISRQAPCNRPASFRPAFALIPRAVAAQPRLTVGRDSTIRLTPNRNIAATGTCPSFRPPNRRNQAPSLAGYPMPAKLRIRLRGHKFQHCPPTSASARTKDARRHQIGTSNAPRPVDRNNSSSGPQYQDLHSADSSQLALWVLVHTPDATGDAILPLPKMETPTTPRPGLYRPAPQFVVDLKFANPHQTKWQARGPARAFTSAIDPSANTVTAAKTMTPDPTPKKPPLKRHAPSRRAEFSSGCVRYIPADRTRQ